MNDKLDLNTRIYTDIQGLSQLKNKDKSVAKKEVAQQFEAMLMQMVMRSMRDATKAVSSGLFSNNAMDIYEDMFDKQLSMTMSSSNLGFAKLVERQLDQLTGEVSTPDIVGEHHAQTSNFVAPATYSQNKPVEVEEVEKKAIVEGKVTQEAPIAKTSHMFSSPEEFIKTLWSNAKKAAATIGAAPEILIAQAALETNWGKSILQQGTDNGSSHNLFNIKADSAWANKTAPVDTLEQKDGVLVKEKSTFRSYASFQESFMDYISFLKNQGRYNEALNKAANPQQFVHALQSAGYATDSQYANKIMKIFSSQTFKDLINKVKNI